MVTIKLARAGAITTLTLARPERRNALTAEMLRELESAALSLHEDETTRAVILAAEGTDFSVGFDLAAAPSAGADTTSLLMRRRGASLGGRLMRALIEVPQPTICAIQGIATGGGACIASACDFRIAAADASVGYGEVKVGMNLMWNALPLCIALVGPARAKRMVMTGALVDAERLERWGFVDEVVAGEDLTAAALSMAQELAALPPVAVQMIKESVNAVSGALGRSLTHADRDQWLVAAGSEDYREAMAAFFARRKGVFKGR